MKTFIIGGTGFISRNIVDILLERGHEVTIFTRGKSPIPFEKNKNLFYETGDRNNKSSLEQAINKKNFDVVMDMAAFTEDQSRSAAEIFKGEAGRFIHCSTVSVYMVSNDVHCPVTEDQDKGELMPDFPRNPFGMDYGINKRKCEDILWSEHNPNTFPVTMLRPVFVCGPEDRTRRDYFWIQRILDDKPLLVPGSGDFAFQQVYVKDTAKAFCDAAEDEITIGEAYNVASEEIYSLNEYIKQMSQILNKDPELIHIDQDVIDNLDLSYFPGADVFPFNTRRTAVFSLDKIKNHLGYKSTPFNEWMPLTIDWYRKNIEASFGYKRRDEELETAEKWKEMMRSVKNNFNK
jgi:dTDP-glucose 4,6-dehydratase